MGGYEWTKKSHSDNYSKIYLGRDCLKFLRKNSLNYYSLLPLKFQLPLLTIQRHNVLALKKRFKQSRFTTTQSFSTKRVFHFVSLCKYGNQHGLLYVAGISTMPNGRNSNNPIRFSSLIRNIWSQKILVTHLAQEIHISLIQIFRNFLDLHNIESYGWDI